MRILSRLPVRRAPIAVAAAAAPAVRRERVADPPIDRAARRVLPTDERPVPLGPARGIAIALGLGALVWVIVAAYLIGR